MATVSTSAPAKIRFVCPECRAAYSVPAKYVGKQTSCLQCQTRVIVQPGVASHAPPLETPTPPPLPRDTRKAHLTPMDALVLPSPPADPPVTTAHGSTLLKEGVGHLVSVPLVVKVMSDRRLLIIGGMFAFLVFVASLLALKAQVRTWAVRGAVGDYISTTYGEHRVVSWGEVENATTNTVPMWQIEVRWQRPRREHLEPLEYRFFILKETGEVYSALDLAPIRERYKRWLDNLKQYAPESYAELIRDPKAKEVYGDLIP